MSAEKFKAIRDRARSEFVRIADLALKQPQVTKETFSEAMKTAGEFGVTGSQVTEQTADDPSTGYRWIRGDCAPGKRKRPAVLRHVRDIIALGR